MIRLKRATVAKGGDALIIATSKDADLSVYGFSADEVNHIEQSFRKEKKQVLFTGPYGTLLVLLKEEKDEQYLTLEYARRAGASAAGLCSDHKLSEVEFLDADSDQQWSLAFAEGFLLSAYKFDKYKKKEKNVKESGLQVLTIVGSHVSDKQLQHLEIVVHATFTARNWVNEPVNTLSATTLATEFRRLGKDAGFKVEVLNKSKITALKMGGLLAVNAGSDEPPTFTIMEYKPAGAKNKKPVMLVGKGVVYDTGGNNLKTGAGMETMKCDMAGAAAVGAAMWAIAKAKLPVHVMAIVPATDNRINGSAYVAGDVITMYNGLTVEVLNTDAEGRLILADALSYAERFKPELVLDFATLTGAAMAAIGQYGVVCMGTASETQKQKLREAGNAVHERLAEFPFWEEYDELIKSDIAEIKNIGGPYGGAITAGKFLSRFVSAPWMHFDIAGPAFLGAKESYKPKGGTGVGVRFLFEFISRY
jgi:leucyl aminopeptidase